MDDQDRIARLAERFADLPEDQAAEIIEGLDAKDREAVAAFAEQKAAHHEEQAEADADMAHSFRAAASADLVETYGAGLDVLDQLVQATQPAGLLAQLEILAKQNPRLLVLGLFSAVVNASLSSLEEREPPKAMRELEQQAVAKWAQDRRDAEAG